ncbi:hypothetical protein DEO72_LG6g931 [Vigna unguiculata]|uniref:Uncharacterized protein n=1 Tax=Vigna unguiculata TaxID=3917 RepID=A0A4D6M4H8_VIGUN|nr:hypothetical protein DEO72_LG6g931 [Vigna unguiculata]
MTSRLGETVSPEQDPGSLKPIKLLTWKRFRAQNIQVTSRPRLGECLSLERETKSLKNPVSHLGEMFDPYTSSETLQLSLRRERSAWSRIAVFFSWSCAKPTTTIPKNN